MERETFSFGDKNNQSKGEQQTAAWERAGCEPTQQSEVTSPARPQIARLTDAETTKAEPSGMSWNSGQIFVGPGGMPAHIAQASGTGAAERSPIDPMPHTVSVRSAPDCTSSHTGRHINGRDLLEG